MGIMLASTILFDPAVCPCVGEGRTAKGRRLGCQAPLDRDRDSQWEIMMYGVGREAKGERVVNANGRGFEVA